VTLGALIATFTVGAALLALWSFVRWPQAAPRTLAKAILHGLFAFASLQLAVVALDWVPTLPDDAAPLAAVAAIVPALTYAFLAGLWVMRLFADAFKGSI
jgi:hypothetical protein